MKRFGTMVWSNDNTQGFINCLYTRDFISDTLDSQDFFVENGCWDGTYQSGTVFCEFTGRTSDETFTADPLYVEDFDGVDISDYNDVIEAFRQNLLDKNI